jgi:hypothetical protein
MADYSGSLCIACGKPFGDDEDIVVCPECGTPYHRECYRKAGKCINEELHAKGGTWTKSPDAEIRDTFTKSGNVCRVCGHENPDGELFCSRCGSQLPAAFKHNINVSAANDEKEDEFRRYVRENGGTGPMYGNIQPFLINFSDPLCGYNPEEDFDGVRLCELADYVETNTHYYLPIFKRLKETGRSASWNFSAMLFPELYFANRKMPLVSLLAFVVRMVASIPIEISTLASIYPERTASFIDVRSTAFSMMLTFGYVLSYALMFFFGIFANRIYYKHAVKKTAKIKRSVPPQFWRGTLRSKGGTSIGLMLAVGFVFLSAKYILAALLTGLGT